MTGAQRASAPAASLELPVVPFQLRCGARLLVSPRPAAPVTALELHVRGGHSLDPEDRGGVAYLAGALLDQGAGERGEEEIAEILELTGGGVSGSSTGLSAHVASAHWRRLVRLAAELITAPRYPRAAFERERQRLYDRLAVERDDPRSKGARLFRELVYGDHWLGRPEAGTCESVARIERRDVASFHRRNWCASRALFAVCGDVEPEAVARLLDRALRGWKRGRPLPPPSGVFPPLRPRAAVHTAARQQVHVNLGHLGVRRRDPDYPALVVMDHILGTGPGFTNRISGKLRDELGLAYSVSANLTASAGLLPGVFQAYIGTSRAHVATAVRVFLDEIRRIQREPVSADELQLAVRYVTGSMALGLERASARARYAVYADRNELPPGHLTELYESFTRITAADVQRAAAEHLHPEAACLTAAGPVKIGELRRILRESAE